MELLAAAAGPAAHITLRDSATGETVWAGDYARLADRLDPEGGYQRIVQWHHSHYYDGSVSYDDAVQVAEVFAAWMDAEQSARDAAGHPRMGLAEANRAASRLLYRAARDAGWRKLTLRERQRLGWEGRTQWQRADEVASRLAELRGFPVDGASEASHRAAGGGDFGGDGEFEAVRRRAV